MNRAACKQYPDLFDATYHVKTPEVIAEAKLVCEVCPVLEHCRPHSAAEEFGVWGGLDEDERRALRKRRNVGPRGPYMVTGAAKRLAQIAEMTAQGLGSQEIAFRLGMSVVTVERRQQMLRSQARREAGVLQRPAPKPECGTSAGYRRHLRRMEAACAACTAAQSEANRRLRNRGAVA